MRHNPWGFGATSVPLTSECQSASSSTPTTTTSAANAAYVSSFNSQLSLYKAELADILPQQSQYQATVATDQFKLLADVNSFRSLMQTWLSAAGSSPGISGDPNSVILTQELNDQIINVSDASSSSIVNFNDYYPAGIPGSHYLDNITDFTTWIQTTLLNNNSAYFPTSATLAAFFNAIPSTLASTIDQVNTDIAALKADTNILNNINTQLSTLQTTITAWLASAEQYASSIGAIPSYQEILSSVQTALSTTSPSVAAAQVAAEPTISASVSASNNTLLYVAAGLGALILLSMLGKK